MRRLVAVVLFAFAGAPPAGAAVTIQPGMQISVWEGGGSCTANFFFDGLGPDLGRAFIGTAAHCSAHRGDDAVGDPVYVGEEQIGHLAVVGDLADHASDYALVEILPSLHGAIVPEVRGHSGLPTGFTTPATVALRDPVLFSGYGMAFGATEPTREDREGTVNKYEDGYYQVTGPLMQGDSGGPVLHAPTGGALGIVSGSCDDYGCLGDGPTVKGILDRVRARGLDLRLRVAGAGPPVAAPPVSAPPPTAPAAPSPAPGPAAAAPRVRATLGCVRRGRARLAVRATAPMMGIKVRGRTHRRTAIRLARLPRRGTLRVTAFGDGWQVTARVRLRACR